MNLRSFIIWGLSLGVASSGWALSQRAAEILDRRNRTLESPPRSLRSNSADLERRMASESERLKVELPQSTNTPSPTTDSLPSTSSPVSEPLSYTLPPSQSGQSVSTRSRGSGFDGRRVFGLGFVGGGAYGVFGTEFDFAVSNDWSVGAGLGTGMSYTSWGVLSRYYFQQGRLNTFFQGGYANWYLSRTSFRDSQKRQDYLMDRFLRDSSGTYSSPTRAHLVYPGIGVLFQSRTGLAWTIQAQYLISLKDFVGALFGGVGLYYYF